MKPQNKTPRIVICINNSGYADDLKVRTIYQVLPDESAARSNYLRIIDETGEDYLFPAAYFMPIELPTEVKQFFWQPISIAKSSGKTKKSKRASAGEHVYA
jgi:hypothetical protein